ncbi:MAG: hypothetical protein NC548_32410 [Lachnospiraceae bacterium]|nr:hypothetical protein [Lachnospiraceae bacterium]
MKRISVDAQKMHDFFDKYGVPLDERIEILRILRSGDELLVCILRKTYDDLKLEYVALLEEKLGPFEFRFRGGEDD